MAILYFQIPVRSGFISGEQYTTRFIVTAESELAGITNANEGDTAWCMDTKRFRTWADDEWVNSAGAPPDATYLVATTESTLPNSVVFAPSTKQDVLVSGTNIKTVNSTSLLGSGDVVISGSGLTQAQVLARGLGS